MIPSISHSSPIITVSVGQEIRVREGHKSVGGEAPSVNGKNNIDREESKIGLESPKSEQIQEVLTRLQETFQHIEPRIELSVDKELNQVIFRFFDKESGEVIRQIPSEKILELQRFFEDQSGLFVEEQI
jgi:flagellar protein FlaG